MQSGAHKRRSVSDTATRVGPGLVLGASLVVFLIGVVIATAVPGPLLTVDDLANFGLARTMAGEGPNPMPPQPPYGLLYPLLLVPGWLAGFGQDAMLLWARLINAACGAATVAVLYALLGRLTDTPGRPRLLMASTAALLPAATVTSSIVWSERLLALLFALLALAMVVALERCTVRWSLLLVTIAAANYAGHPRHGLLAVVAVLVAAYSLRGKRLTRAMPLMVLVFAVGVALLVGVEGLRRIVADAAFGSSGTYNVSDLSQRRGWGLLDQMVQHGGGTLAYLVLATGGLAVLGAVHLLRHRDGRWILLAGAAVLIVASWFLTGVPRSDKWLHGRYIEVAAPVLVTFGLAMLASLPTRRALMTLGLLPVLAGVFAAWNGPGNVWTTSRSPVMMLGVEVSGAPYRANLFNPTLAATVAVVVGMLVWLLARYVGGNVAVLAFLAVCLIGARSGLAKLDSLYDRTPFGEIEMTLPESEQVTELYVDPGVVSANLTNSLAWKVGFDRTVLTPSDQTTHMLIPGNIRPERVEALVTLPGVYWAYPVAAFRSGVLWRLP